MVARGERDLADGNVASARHFPARGDGRPCARRASAGHHLRSAGTGAFGRPQVQPSLAEARKWYERAHELGAPEAQERLARLAGG